MSRLLSANFRRLLKDKVFWIACIFTLGFGIFASVSNYMDSVKSNYPAPQLDNFFFDYSMILTLPLAAFCSLFLGTEYSDGTIRNKLIIGHSRHAIYSANLIVCAAAGFFMAFFCQAAAAAIGIPLLGSFDAGSKTVLLCFLNSALNIVVFASIFTLISMLSQNKALVSVINLLGTIALFLVAMKLYTQLTEPEFYSTYVMNAAGESSMQNMPNPHYLTGMARSIYEFLFNFLPSGQAYHISSMTAPNIWQLPLYQLFWIIVTTISGLFMFRKKDIK